MTPAAPLVLRDACIGPTVAEYGEWPPEHLRSLIEDVQASARRRGMVPSGLALALADVAERDGEHGAAQALRCAAAEMLEPGVWP